nr:uncharacterized protein LOC123494693 [Aegilops tauschii subsp. strangulata]
MSSYLVSAPSLSPDGLTYLLVVMFLSRRHLLSFVLRRPVFALLGYLWFLQCWPPELLCHLLASLPHHSCPLLQGGVSRPLYAEKSTSHRDTFCGYCSRSGHPESDSRQKKRDQRRSPSSGPPASSSTQSLIDQDIVRLKRLLASSGSSSTGSAAAMTASPSTSPQASTQSGSSHQGFGWCWPPAP